jgi:hypothetical protein
VLGRFTPDELEKVPRIAAGAETIITALLNDPEQPSPLLSRFGRYLVPSM